MIGSENERKITRRASLIFLTLICGGLSWLLTADFGNKAAAAEKDNRLATALFAEGTLVVTRADGAVKRLSGQGSLPLFEGDKLETGRVSQGFLVFRDGSRLALNNSTTLILRVRKEGANTIQEVKLNTGEIWALIAEKTKRFEVETPNALAGVSGTEFGESYLENQSALTVGKGLMDFGLRLAQERTLGQIPAKNRVKVDAGKQSKIQQRALPTAPVEVNVDKILAWGRALNARFGKGPGIDEGGEPGFPEAPFRKDSRPGGASH